jgi:periplasmic protein TonB
MSTTMASYLRFPLALALGFAITTAMFNALFHLTEAHQEFKTIEATNISFTRVRQNTETVSRREEKVERVKVPDAVVIPEIIIASAAVEPTNISFSPNIDISGAMKSIGAAMGLERGIVPVLRVPPAYPRNAKVAKIEGYVTMEVVVNPDGSVADIHVLDAAPPRLFDIAAVEAMRRWKFQPKLVNGSPVSQRAQQTIEFKLEGG